MNHRQQLSNRLRTHWLPFKPTWFTRWRSSLHLWLSSLSVKAPKRGVLCTKAKLNYYFRLDLKRAWLAYSIRQLVTWEVVVVVHHQCDRTIVLNWSISHCLISTTLHHNCSSSTSILKLWHSLKWTWVRMEQPPLQETDCPLLLKGLFPPKTLRIPSIR